MPELSKDAGGLVTMIDKVAVGPNVNGEITYIHVDPLGQPAIVAIVVASVLILLFFYYYLYPIVMKTVFGIDPQEKSILKRRFFIPRMPWPRQHRTLQSNNESGNTHKDQEVKRMSDAEAGMSPRSQFYKLNNGPAFDLSLPNMHGASDARPITIDDVKKLGREDDSDSDSSTEDMEHIDLSESANTAVNRTVV